MPPLLHARHWFNSESVADFSNGQLIGLFIAFLLLAILVVMLFVWGFVSCWLTRRARSRNAHLTQKQIQHRACLLTSTFGLILLSKRFKKRQAEDFGIGTVEPGQSAEVYEYQDPREAGGWRRYWGNGKGVQFRSTGYVVPDVEHVVPQAEPQVEGEGQEKGTVVERLGKLR